jgi:hypothetical protein
MVNDPGGERGWGAYPGQTIEMAQLEREKLFDIIRDLVKWENTNNEEVLEKARSLSDSKMKSSINSDRIFYKTAAMARFVPVDS